MKRPSSTQWIAIAMIVGIALGYFFPAAEYPNVAIAEKAISSVFLRMIKSLIVPLIFGTLVVGIAGHGDDMRRVGRLAFRSIVYFEVVTTIALAIGLFAVALARVPGRPKQVMLDFCESLAEVMFKFTALVMGFSPFGIGAAIAMTVSASGLGVLRNLAVLVGTLYGACLVCILLVYLPIAVMFRIPVRAFWSAVKEPALIAFSTASGEAALPLAMERLEEFGLPKRIIAFVLPTGYSFNLAGSTLYLGVGRVFAAKAAGIDMPVSRQLLMMLTLMLTSKGVAAVPRAALVILSGALTMFGLPLQVVAVLLGVDALLDMARTAVNLLGNCLATAVMARWEGEFPDTVNGAIS